MCVDKSVDGQEDTYEFAVFLYILVCMIES